MPRWFSWLPTIPSRCGRTLHSSTALHCNSTRSLHHPDQACLPRREQSGTHSSPQLPAAQNRPIVMMHRSLRPAKKESYVPATMHLAENSNHPPTPRSPGQEAEQHRPRVSLATRERLCASPCASPSTRRAPLLPRFCHASTLTPNKDKQQATSPILPCVWRERADAWRTSPFEGLVGLVGFFSSAGSG